MFELLAGFALLQASAASIDAAPAYARDSLSGFVAIENSRPVDGIDYGNGTVSAGLVYAHPRGLFAGTEFLASHGDGTGMPAADILGLRTFAGFAFTVREHQFAIELLDYRVDATMDRFEYQGLGFRYRQGGFQLEFAHERERPYYYSRLQRFFLYDNNRLAIGWEQAFNDDLSWSVGAGASRIGGIELDYHFVTGSLYWRAAGADWQAGVSWASDELETFYGTDVDRRQLVLRVALPFQIF